MTQNQSNLVPLPLSASPTNMHHFGSVSPAISLCSALKALITQMADVESGWVQPHPRISRVHCGSHPQEFSEFADLCPLPETILFLSLDTSPLLPCSPAPSSASAS
uniref:Uncharacterized protein n=1 Tax=Mus musculus TaxID=10090 RepID=Q3UCH3_MOUSE|nr:unnamed protein product [Mus musculus]